MRVQILKMVAMILYLMHILGCFWFFVATNSGYEGTLEAGDTWLARYDGGSVFTIPLGMQVLTTTSPLPTGTMAAQGSPPLSRPSTSSPSTGR